MNNRKSFLQHLLFFVIIEVIFVIVLFRELPETNRFTLIGVLHTSYWWILLVAWWIREKVHKVRQKFLCSYIPLLYHVFVHVWVSVAALEELSHHDEHSLPRLISWWVLLGWLIWLWEWRLHRSVHCETHHQTAHAHCHDHDCEIEH